MRRVGILISVVMMLILVTRGIAWSDYNGVLSELFFAREPIARAQALGRAYVAIDDDGAAIFYNPAAGAAFGAPSACFSHSDRYYTLEDAAFTFGQVTVPLGRFGSIGFGKYHFDYGLETLDGNTTTMSAIATAYSRRLKGDLFVGLGFERVRQDLTDDGSSAYLVNLGFLWSIWQSQSGSSRSQECWLGSSIMNLGGSSITMGDQDFELPIIFRGGGVYRMSWQSASVLSSLETLAVLVDVEYESLLNSAFHRGLRVGAEIRVLEAVSLRVGHYDERLDDFRIESNRNSIEQTTYGFGIRVPMDKFSSRLPVTVGFDLTALDSPSLVKGASPTHRYRLYTISVQGVGTLARPRGE
ncbi:MAG: hypothetical protein ABIJ00_00195 [Candidatus Eisenbacteria bacterium]